jgi:hypothetical protein
VVALDRALAEAKVERRRELYAHRRSAITAVMNSR